MDYTLAGLDLLLHRLGWSMQVGVWASLKRSLANLAKHTIGQLTALIKTRLRQMQDRPGLLDGYLVGTGLDLTPYVNAIKV